jgi:hypothetical protein
VLLTWLEKESLKERLVPSIVLLLYVTELLDPGGAYVTVRTTYFGDILPVIGVGVGGGGGGGGGGGLQVLVKACPVGPPEAIPDVEPAATPPGGNTFAGGWQICAKRSGAENTHMRIPIKKLFFTCLPLFLKIKNGLAG